MKRIILLIAVVYIVGMCSACNSTKLADSFVKDTVIASAKQVIEYMNSGEFDSVNAMVREDVKKILTIDVLSDAARKTYGKAGSFVEYKDINIVGKRDKDTDYAIALVQAKYEKLSVLFTISFDNNLDVVAIYMKKYL